MSLHVAKCTFLWKITIFFNTKIRVALFYILRNSFIVWFNRRQLDSQIYFSIPCTISHIMYSLENSTGHFWENENETGNQHLGFFFYEIALTSLNLERALGTSGAPLQTPAVEWVCCPLDILLCMYFSLFSSTIVQVRTLTIQCIAYPWFKIKELGDSLWALYISCILNIYELKTDF